MIFVTVGTQDKPFTRLLDLIQKAIDDGVIKDDVIVQAGYTRYKSKDMKIFDLVSQEEYEKNINDCDLLITHGGVGNILTGLKYGKKIIAVPRLAQFGEHTNDHQTQIVNRFALEGYLLKCDLDDNFEEILKKVRNFKPKKYKFNNVHFCKCLKEEIEKL